MTETLAGECIYEQHHVHLPAFGPSAASTPATRGARRASSQNAAIQQYFLQDRLGFHTFRRGDVVSYTCQCKVLSTTRL
eukprot:4317171-Pleurochrysis_carterae.AAC.1